MVVDVSLEMTAIWEQKARRAGVVPEIHVQTVESFLETDRRLGPDHVLLGPAPPGGAAVVLAAAARLAPGGMILTMFDPTPGDSVLRLTRRADWLMELLVSDPRGFVRLARDKASRRAQGEDLSGASGEWPSATPTRASTTAPRRAVARPRA